MPAELTARRRALALAVVALATIAPLGALAALPAQAETASSANTVTAKDYDPDAATSPFPDLKVSVSQTKDLIQQGLTVSWTGGKQSTVPTSQTGGANFLQIAQCWGDEAGSNGTRPDRRTCQYGGFNIAGDSRWSNRSSDQIAAEDATYTAPGAGWWEPSLTAVPFNSATGVSLASVIDGKRIANAPDLNSNEFFTGYTTNEVSWAGFGAGGSGSTRFELQTVQQSPGLGCGERLAAPSGSVSGRSCWLVVIPRGDRDVDGSAVIQSGLLWQTWKHHIAIRLSFKPTGLSCPIGAAERQLSGSELISAAMGQWQPKLCNSSSGAVYSLLTGPESDAALAANGTTKAPMAITSRALSADGVTDNLAYAPIALSGGSIAFAVDRNLDAFKDLPAEVKARQNLAFSTLRLTPRLLAKLLTATYVSALPLGADKAHISKVENITKDPDFLAINDPEWSSMALYGPGISDLQTPLGRSDVAEAVWSYILANTDAKAFLNGQADPWGMKMNPYYSTNATVNPNGAAMELPRDDFPKADPATFVGTEQNGYADTANLVTYRPFCSSLDTSAYLVLRGDPQALGDWDATAMPPKYGKLARALVGTQRVMGLTDTPAAAKYQVLQASLLNPAGEFVAPTDTSMSAAAAAMTTNKAQRQVVRYDPSSAAAKKAKAAYPLTMPIYAAVNPAMSGAAVRADYAGFISAAVTGGQTPGTGDGQLPAGYTPLPAAWKKQALAAASAIKAGKWPTATPTPTTTPTTGTSTPSGGVGTTPTTPATPTNPVPSGDPAGSLAGANTAADPAIGVFSALVPAGAGVGLVAALGVPMLSRFRRRQT